MGTDIHAFIEYELWQNPKEGICVTNFAELDLVRDYLMFYALVGRRGLTPPTIAPRGIPEHTSDVADNDLYTYIGPNYAEDQHRHCTLKHAQSWVSPDKKIEYRNGQPFRIVDADYYGFQYLYIDELRAAFTHYLELIAEEQQHTIDLWKKVMGDATPPDGRYPEDPSYPYQFQAIIDAMQAINGANPKRSWLLFWFDN
jgi:hypothetical protein